MKTHWTENQRLRLCELIDLQDKGGCWIGYWCSDQHGRSCNGGKRKYTQAVAGQIQEEDGDGLIILCQEGTLHGTAFPHMWKGCRVWMVALFAPFSKHVDKTGSRKREIIGEILPEETISASVGIRMGIKDLWGVDLRSANLEGADLRNANLRNANLMSVNLVSANLMGANLISVNLESASLLEANLRKANLRDADLGNANLMGANLVGANLVSANLESANLWEANLRNANLMNANLRDANLVGVNLVGANLVGANLRDAKKK